MYPIVERHYTLPSGVIPRTMGDAVLDDHDRRISANLFLDELRPPAPEAPSLIPSATGPIKRLLLTIPSYAVDDGPDYALSTVYRDLIQKLPGTTSFTVMTHKSTVNAVETWFSDARRAKPEIVPAPDDLNFSIWAEDGYVIAVDAAHQATFFVQPYTFPRYGDALIASYVSNATDLRDTQAPLIFQGGNCLIGDSFFFIGADYAADSLRYVNKVLIPQQGETPKDAVHRAYLEYLDHGRELRYIGSTIPVPAQQTRSVKVNGESWTETIYFGNGKGTTEPLFHIDMFVTLVGRDNKGKFNLLVGSPQLAADVLGIALWPTAMQGVFDNIAKSLASSGFVVHRNPLPLVYMDDSKAKERTWYFATSNNALVENIDGGTKMVWLPTYGHGNWASLAKTDDANRAVWEGLGFTPVLLGDFHPFAENLGAVHCIKKYLRR